MSRANLAMSERSDLRSY